ncbi:redoxin domain-containing protein [Shewanella sp. D64]|uniref:redoxin domain-containing protein n=1 Tax=unclassified Shewanella TaxID=196818 RepID=UPI0022BA2561|nr:MULTISPECIES: redoxin domain-containing protein [unclassified Shewanella]MEC4727903.1 redoxin domain-containing protein [Shewanella sp. D64]MEC4739945.1 redoxin domain-containing protein [Shewanella sp. E94]WBJ97093.1 redoxin domain-containing protein [Shewanella sp. MTB7]
MTHFQQAPELDVSGWLNTDNPITLEQLKGQVVLIHAFQMLCPACVSHGLPQTQAVHKLFADEKVTVLGLHTVFEHHQVMNKAALEAFVSEYRLTFPIAIDTPSTQGVIPKTMHTYMLRGTPSLIVIDKQGNIRLNHFGRISDLQLGNFLGQLLAEPLDVSSATIQDPSSKLDSEQKPPSNCDPEGCAI